MEGQVMTDLLHHPWLTLISTFCSPAGIFGPRPVGRNGRHGFGLQLLLRLNLRLYPYEYNRTSTNGRRPSVAKEGQSYGDLGSCSPARPASKSSYILWKVMEGPLMCLR
ncbi:hypothetical protein AV530_006006 [Patagioenas fasciata monilis]|uniref:Uncharacterized protein n=1 Tax=Patagioenas fasciata monilis TaxID=372326 RepID=A0A1V4JND8_PATFA|nr:hypothetical protein AV530_006006 [Patagioenas fasciata monilis]